MNTTLVRQLTEADAADYRALMLDAYQLEPDAFTSTVEERQSLPLSWWQARIGNKPDASEWVFGACCEGVLVGLAGLSRGQRERTSHKGTLFGMYVAPGHRNRGLARLLVQAVLAKARDVPGLVLVQLTVTEGNQPATKLYESCGFISFGVEPLANRIGAAFVSKRHMWCRVSADMD
ncbi:GNAT family N-acetyltransferase [Leptothrix sp. BB-4]